MLLRFKASTLVLSSSFLILVSSFPPEAGAVHSKNAGPEKVELKFKLPPPKPLSPEEAMKSFAVERGFRIELVASEPMIESPVAMSFDDQGRLYVCEMRGYMHDLAGSTEKEPTGRVSLLEDTNGDGRMDKATAFLDKVVMPRAVMAVNGGALIAVPPQLLFCKDTDGDGVADVKDVVATDFGTLGGQPEHMANSPVWAMDNSIWSAGYSSRLKLRGGVWQKDVGLGRGQWGLCQDDHGRLYFNYNSDMLRADLLPTEAFARNPLLRNATSINAKLAADQTLYASHPTPGVNRGYDAKTLSADGRLTKPTATCGALIYRGDAFPAAYRGNAFVPEPAANLVKRFTMSEADGLVKATNTAKGSEFLTSTDERFRPVNACNGPDGALYLVDMYRGIIQHQSFLTHYLIANIQARKLEQPFNMGRIWRIVPEGSSAKPVKVTKDAKLLTHANGWVRDTAQRLIVESGDASTVPALKELLQNESPIAREHALWTLDGLAAITPDLVKTALADKSEHVRAAAARVAPRDYVFDLAAEKHPLVLANIAIKTINDAALAPLLVAHGKNALIREAALTGLRGKEAAFAKTLAQTPSEGSKAVIGVLAELIALAGKAGPIADMLELAASSPENRDTILKGLAKTDSKSKTVKLVWLEKEPEHLKQLKLASSLANRLVWPGKPGAPAPPVIKPLTETQTALFEKGKTIYATLCAACHQPHGFGLDGLAPPLVDSEWVLGKPEVLARIVMHGLAGPVKVSGRTYNLAMPPLPQLTDEDIAGVLTYIRREWEHTAGAVETASVTKIRDQEKGRMMMWTETELKNLGKKR
ncbi:MAG: c-type cytochrome [Verrucomicrobiaceae bacterium]|nr:c-type cytochrome [Verrucomicrobiaceae bacterium]